jgi:ABC-type nitrate/sulfonate/bicarbonate transport system substrate-binding protein
MSLRLRIGYIPLLDSALLHVAATQGMAEDAGLHFELIRETSWANIRDKLALGIFDAAHMLAPAAMASSLGLGHFRAPLVAPVALNLDGNAITLSLALHASVIREIDGDPKDPGVTAAALARVIAARRRENLPPLALAHVFPYSSHHYQLRLWLGAGGIDPDRDLRLIVVPPPFMTQSLAKGLVDGFCVGAPWNSLAEDAGVGRVLHPGCDIVRDCPEKVLAFRADWAEQQASVLHAATSSIEAASRWTVDPQNRETLGTLLSTHVGFDISPALVLEILERGSARPRAWLRLDPAAVSLSAAQPLWLYEQMVAAGQTPDDPDQKARALATYLTDVGTSPEAPSSPRAFFAKA